MPSPARGDTRPTPQARSRVPDMSECPRHRRRRAYPIWIVDNRRRTAQLLLGGFCAYVGFYFLLMSRTASLDAAGNLAYLSTFRFAPSIRSNGPMSIFAGQACFLNRLFYPMDWVY